MRLKTILSVLLLSSVTLHADSVDLHPYFNGSCFDDGMANNGKGGWTDEGLNDYFTYPPLDFGLQRFRGYSFNLVDPESNDGKNLILLGHHEVWPDTPDRIAIEAINQKGRFLFVMHSEGRVKDETAGREAGHILLTHPDEEQPLMSNGRAEQGEGWKPEEYARAQLWANVELYCSTGQTSYWNEVVRLKDTPAVTVAGSVRHGILFSLLISERKHPDPSEVEKIKKDLLVRAENRMRTLVEEGEEGYGVPAPKSGGWGSTSCLVRNIEEITRAYLLTKKPEYLDAIAQAIDFSFGMNPSEMSWVTGGGTIYPMDPLNLNCSEDGIEDPHPGILIYGPGNYWNNNGVMLYPNKAEMGIYRRVTDTWGVPAQNAYSVWETQAPLLFAVGCLLPDRE